MDSRRTATNEGDDEGRKPEHSKTESTAFPLPTSSTCSNMPRYDKNINTSKTQKVPDSTITRKFPISIKLLKDTKSAKNDTVSDDPKDENKSHERNAFTRVSSPYGFFL